MTFKAKSKTQKVTLADQLLFMQQRWGSTWHVRKTKDGFTATGRVQPDALSREYEVRMTYDGVTPKVHVVSPELEARGKGEPIPHVYEGNRLCLYKPSYREWTPQMLIANTIVPWISEWLYWYEIWHVTGEWLGGGEHPTTKPVNEDEPTV